ncbi:hypothetical protein [Hymenobacter defluvii]|nr:hypothetical protein [Hymenobacter defluvii]
MKLLITELRTVWQWRAATGLDAVRFDALVPGFFCQKGGFTR